MSITIANLVAQVGADLSQFRVGMNEVEARMNLANARSQSTSLQINKLRQAHKDYANDAQAARDKADRLTSTNIPNQRTVAANAATETARRTRELQEAEDKFNLARARLTSASVGGATPARDIQIEAERAVKNYSRANNQQAVAARNQANAEARINTIIAQRDALLEKETRLRRRSAYAGQSAVMLEQRNDLQAEVMRAYAKRKQQDSIEHLIRAFNSTGTASIKTGASIAAGLGGVDVIGNQFNQMVITAAHNTSLATAGVQSMISSVKQLGIDSGASMDQIAEAYRKVENYGYNADQIVKILNQSIRASVAYGSDMSETSEALVRVIKEFNLPVSSASTAMNILVETAKKSSQSMSQLVDVYGTMSAYSANLGVSLLDTSAAFVTMTRHGLDAHQASTQFQNDIMKIIKPSKEVMKLLKDVDEKTGGFKLAKDFTMAGLAAKGLSGVWKDIHDKAQLYIKDSKEFDTPIKKAAALAVQAMPFRRGQLGAAISTGTGYTDLMQEMKELHKVANGKDMGLGKDYAESLEQTNQQFTRLRNSAIVLASSVSTALNPMIKSATDKILALASGYNSLEEVQKSNIVHNFVLASGSLILAGVLLKVVAAVASLKAAWIALGVTITPLGLAITGAVLAIGYAIWKIVDAINGEVAAQSRLKKQNQIINENNVKLAATNYEHASSLTHLVNEYKNASNKIHKTASDYIHLKDILSQIASIAPDMIAGWNAQGQAIRLVGEAADVAADKLGRLALQSRAANMTQLQLVERPKLQANLDDARKKWQIANNVYGMVKNRHTSKADSALTAEAAEDLRNKRQVYRQAVDAVHAINNQIQSALVIPDSAASARKRSIADLAKDIDIVADKLNKAKDVANGWRSKGIVRGTVDEYTKQLAILKHEYALRQREIVNDVNAPNSANTGVNKYPTTPGADPFEGIYDKKTKTKKQKESELDQLRDRYASMIEGFKKSEFELANVNEGNTNSGVVSTRWETMAHGMITVAGASRTLAGDYQSLTTADKEAAIEAARHVDILKMQDEQLKKIKQLRLDNASKSGKDISPMEGLRAKASSGSYFKDYGKYGLEALASDFRVIDAANKRTIEESRKKIEEEINRPLQVTESVHDKMVKAINGEGDYYNSLGTDNKSRNAAVEKMAAQAQANTDASKAAELYNSTLEEVNSTLSKSKEELALNSKITDEATIRIKLQTDAYKDLNAWQKIFIVGVARQADAVNRLNTIHKAHINLNEHLSSHIDKAHDSLLGATNPDEVKKQEFIRSAWDAFGKDNIAKMSPFDKANTALQIEISAQQAMAYDKQAERAEHLAEIMKKVTEASKEMTTVMKINTADIKISVADWNALTKAQQTTIKQFERMREVKTEVNTILDGISNLFMSTLEHIREHGFHHFFRDIIKGFDDMMFQMAAKWATQQVMQFATKSIGGALTGMLGGLGKGGKADADSAQASAAAAATSSTMALVNAILALATSAASAAATVSASGAGGSSGNASGIMSLFGGSNSSVGSPDLNGIDGAFAGGGIASGGKSYLVGEYGPEIFTPRDAGRVSSNTRDVGGDTHVHINVNGVQNAESFRQSKHQIAQQMMSAIQQANKR